jgi:hypothetical protein
MSEHTNGVFFSLPVRSHLAHVVGRLPCIWKQHPNSHTATAASGSNGSIIQIPPSHVIPRHLRKLRSTGNKRERQPVGAHPARDRPRPKTEPFDDTSTPRRNKPVSSTYGPASRSMYFKLYHESQAFLSQVDRTSMSHPSQDNWRLWGPTEGCVTGGH